MGDSDQGGGHYRATEVTQRVAQHELSVGCSESTARPAQNRHRLVIDRGRLARRPIDEVLGRSGDGPVVLGGGEYHAVGVGDGLFQLSHRQRLVGALQVLVEHWNIGCAKNREAHRFVKGSSHRLEEPKIVRVGPEASANAQNSLHFLHPIRTETALADSLVILWAMKLSELKPDAPEQELDTNSLGQAVLIAGSLAVFVNTILLLLGRWLLDIPSDFAGLSFWVVVLGTVGIVVALAADLFVLDRITSKPFTMFVIAGTVGIILIATVVATVGAGMDGATNESTLLQIIMTAIAGLVTVPVLYRYPRQNWITVE